MTPALPNAFQNPFNGTDGDARSITPHAKNTSWIAPKSRTAPAALGLAQVSYAAHLATLMEVFEAHGLDAALNSGPEDPDAEPGYTALHDHQKRQSPAM